MRRLGATLPCSSQSFFLRVLRGGGVGLGRAPVGGLGDPSEAHTQRSPREPRSGFSPSDPAPGESPRGLIKKPGVGGAGSRLGRGLKICISNKFAGAAIAAGPEWSAHLLAGVYRARATCCPTLSAETPQAPGSLVRPPLLPALEGKATVPPPSEKQPGGGSTGPGRVVTHCDSSPCHL